ncbi:MAG: hypothetical protein JXB88_20935 [Spirochaetales bacterium]|nr:hypothetical protein [Spirochaetales bacterium]
MDKLFVCNVCGHIEFNHIPEKCPVCGASKVNFRENPDAIIPSEKEGKEKHVPVITVTAACGMIDDCRDIHIKIGSTTHPMQQDHWIVWIDIYVNNNYTSRYTMLPDSMQPAVSIHVKKSVTGKLTVVHFCNKHGRWIANAEL